MTCETCGQAIDDELRCEYGDCDKAAVLEGWFRGGGMVRRLNVCVAHASLSIGGEKAAREALGLGVDA